MASEHDNFVFESGVGAGDLGNDIAARLMIAVKLSGDVQAYRDRHMVGDQPMHASKGLGRNGGGRNHLLVLGAIDPPAERHPGIVADLSTGAGWAKHGNRVFVGEESADFFEERHFLEDFFPERGIAWEHVAVALVAIKRV